MTARPAPAPGAIEHDTEKSSGGMFWTMGCGTSGSSYTCVKNESMPKRQSYPSAKPNVRATLFRYSPV